MALSAPVVRDTRDARLYNPQVVNTSVIYPGGYTAWANQNHATSATQGRALPWTGAAGQVPAQFCNQQTPALGSSVTGTTGDTTASPIVRVGIDTERRVVHSCPVTGLAGTIDDVQRWVYATADGTFDVTLPAAPNRLPVGIITDFLTSTTADVLFFSYSDLLIVAMCGGGVTTWMMGTISAELASTGNMLTGIVAPCHGVIQEAYAICVSEPTDSDVSIAVNLEIGGTNVTGGVITLAAADVIGEKKAGTSITVSTSIMHAGDLIDVEGTVTSAGTAKDGVYNLYAVYTREPGL